MTTRVAINGLGRIGRQAFKIASENPELEIVAINELGDIENMAYLLRHDTVYHGGSQSVRVSGNELTIDGKRYQMLAIADPEELPWGQLGVEVVIESTGRFTSKQQAEAHLRAGAKAVVVSAPAKGAASFVLGVNDQDYDPQIDTVISNASCTTNSITPVMAVLDEKFGV